MAKIIGIIVVIASVLGGFILSGGKVAALIHPFEVMIIGGAALGGFLQANPGSTTKIVFCLLYTSPSPRDATLTRMPSSA